MLTDFLPYPPRIVVMGISGSGKSTVGSRLAERLRVPFLDGDWLHPPENVAKMVAGIPLTDADRRPWLSEIGVELRNHSSSGLVVACSALRRSYRRIILWEEHRTLFVHLNGHASIIVTRQADRVGHFMPTSLIQDQLKTLEPLDADEPGMTVDVSEGIEQIVDRIEATVTAMHEGQR